MANVTVDILIRLRWWVRPYLAGLVGFARLTGMEPDWDKVRLMLRHGVAVRIGEAKAYGNGRQKDP